MKHGPVTLSKARLTTPVNSFANCASRGLGTLDVTGGRDCAKWDFIAAFADQRIRIRQSAASLKE
jgi:hypothetical protein